MKHDMLRVNPASRRFDLIFFNVDNRCVLIDGQRPRDMRQKSQRMELRLMCKADRPGCWEGQRRFPYKGGGKSQRRGGLRLGLKLLAVVAVDIGVPLLKRAVDALRLNQAPVFLDRRFVGHGVLLRAVTTQAAHQLAIDHPVLRGDFRRCVPCLPAADPPGVEHNDLPSGFLQPVGGQDSREPCADDGDFRLRITVQRLAFRDPAAFTPN